MSNCSYFSRTSILSLKELFMKWIKEFQLFLFDFDGLLVNTEHLQFQAYKEMCLRRGFALRWPFSTYCLYAHSIDKGALFDALCKTFPKLQEEEPNRSVLYEEKKKIYEELLKSSEITLMPGVDLLLHELERARIPRVVVTHSTKAQTEQIQSKLPLLKSVPYWITREDYVEPKPSPEGYLRAITLYGKKKDRIIGFEDAPRGIEALKQTSATVVMISPFPYEHKENESQKVLHYPSFVEMFSFLE
jgi:beta-phosphoglucomutase